MSTATAPAPAPVVEPLPPPLSAPPIVAPAALVVPSLMPDPARILLTGLSWQTYRLILDETGDRRRTRMAFNRGALELMSPGPLHEEDSNGFDRTLAIICEEAEIDFKSYGSTTWHRDDAERGIEADQCYYFTAAKLAAAGEATRRGSNDSSEYPIPDLAIEIDMRRSALDRAEIYATLGVPEVWSFEAGRLHVFALGDDRVYVEAEASRFVPIPPAEIARWADAFEKCDNERLWARDCRAWVRAALEAPA